MQNVDPNSIQLLSNLIPIDIIDNKEAINFLGQLTNLDIETVNLDEYLDEKIDDIIIRIYLEFIKQSKSLKFETNQICYDDLNITNSSRDEQIVLIVYLITMVINRCCLVSVKFKRNFLSKNGLDLIFTLLKNDYLFSLYSTLIITDSNGFQKDIDVISIVILNICQLSRIANEYLSKWDEQDAINLLLKISKTHEKYQLDLFMTIVNIADDNQIETLTEIHGIVQHLQTKITEISQDLNQKNFQRHTRQIIDEDRIIKIQVQCIFDSDHITPVTFYLLGLYRLSVNDKLRQQIYFQNKFHESLKGILFEGNEYEIKFTLRVYAQLTFNNDVCKHLCSDQNLIDFISSLKSSSESSKLSDQILWNISQSKKNKDSTSKIGEHVMISYNSASRDLCLKIKSQLENVGLTVWMDVGNIHGSSLDSMAKAVENCFCILVCITEKYRTSINCQAEALYAFKLNKPIIPLIMQKGYENVQGWLGIILGDKIFVNFTKYEFNECMKRLNHEIDCFQKDIVNNVPKIGNSNKEAPEKWDAMRIKQWFESNNLNINIYKELSPCDGTILQQLFKMRRDAPEFFYQSLKSFSVDMRSILHFTSFLEKLF